MLKIKSEKGQVNVEYPPANPEETRLLIDELKDRLNTSLYGVCPLFGLKPDDNGCRTIRRWYAHGKQYQPIPDHHWRMMLVLLHGFRKLPPRKH